MSATSSPGVGSLEGRRRGLASLSEVDERYALTMSASERSIEQRMAALRHANEIRSQRAALKRDIRAGRRHVIRVLVAPPEFVLTMKVTDLLLAAPKYGRVKVNKILSQCRISPSKTVGGLSERQRYELAVMMGARRRSR